MVVGKDLELSESRRIDLRCLQCEITRHAESAIATNVAVVSGEIRTADVLQ